SYAGPGVQTSAGATLGVVGGIFTPDAGRLDWGGAGAIPQVWTSAAPPTGSGFSLNLATGQDASGAIQTTGDLADAHWTVSNADNYKNGPIAYTTAPGDRDWNGPWGANGPGSSWIAADPDNSDNGNVTYTFTFDLTGYNPADATLSGGQFKLDDSGTVYLNGHALGSAAHDGWTVWTALSNGAGDFVSGMNTIAIQTTNSDRFLEAARFEGAIIDTVSTNPPTPVHWANAVSGDFATAADWTEGVVPGANNGVVLGAFGSTAYSVTSSVGEIVYSLQTAAKATLAITGGVFAVTAGTGTAANAGTVQIGAGATFSVGGSLANHGVIAIDCAGSPASASVVIAQNTTLSGGGKITLTDFLMNDIAGGASAATLTNLDNTITGAGTIGSGALTLINQASGIINATGATALTLDTGANAIGNAGVIKTTGAGGLMIDSAVTNTGVLNALGAGLLVVSGATVTNTGGAVSVGKGGHISLQGGTISGGTLTLAVGGVLSGDGGGGALTSIAVTNAGTIDAASHFALTLNTGATAIVNTGLLEATGSGGLTIDGAVANAGGTILAGNANVVIGAAISGGTLGVVGTGTIDAAGATFDGATSALTNQGVVDIADSQTLSLEGAIVNSGTIAAQGAGHATTLAIAQNTPLSGGGQVTLSDSLSNQIVGGVSAATLTNVDNTIAGAGTIGSATLTLVNEAAGIVDATGPNALILATGSNTVANAGLIEATGAGGLTISGTTVDGSAGGTILAGDGSRVRLASATLIGGTLKSAGTGVIRTFAGANTLDGTTSAVTNQAILRVTNHTALAIEGAIANAGRIDLRGSGAATTLAIGGAGATLSGGGVVDLADKVGNAIVGASPAATLTNVDNRIMGAGTLGGGSLTLVNGAMGVILGDFAAGLVIDTGANTIVNAGLIEAADGGAVSVLSALDNSGTLLVARGTLTLDGAVTGGGIVRIRNGALDAVGAFTENVDFTHGKGVLELARSQAYAGAITGFSKAGGTSLDLRDIGFVSAAEATYSGTASGGVLTVTDGTHTANIALVGDYTASTFTAGDDGHGGVIVLDPSAPGAGPAPKHAFIAAMAGLGGRAAAAATQAGAAWRGYEVSLVKPMIA
ncbi:MAG: hypothetical protein ABI306_09205, partial [Caulobacteraceae bacterium]